jgi:hypothetical protein
MTSSSPTDHAGAPADEMRLHGARTPSPTHASSLGDVTIHMLPVPVQAAIRAYAASLVCAEQKPKIRHCIVHIIAPGQPYFWRHHIPRVPVMHTDDVDPPKSMRARIMFDISPHFSSWACVTSDVTVQAQTMGGLDVRVDTYALGPTARLLAREFNVMNDKGVQRRHRGSQQASVHSPLVTAFDCSCLDARAEFVVCIYWQLGVSRTTLILRWERGRGFL